jgi:hypothetical protein
MAAGVSGMAARMAPNEAADEDPTNPFSFGAGTMTGLAADTSGR